MSDNNDPGRMLYQSADTEPDTYFVDENQDHLPPLTVGMYRAFVAKGRAGMQALMVYLHLLFTYRLQRTDHVYATNDYIQRGLGMGERIIKNAKGLLRKMGLIETIRRRDDKGRIAKTYLKLNLLPNPGANTIGAGIVPLDTIGAVFHPVDLDRKCLKKKKKMLEEENRDVGADSYPHNFESWWNIYPRKKEKRSALAKWKAAIRAGASERQLLAAARNYAAECKKEGRQDKYIKHAATFLSHTEPWKEYLVAPRFGLLRACPHCQKEQEHTGADCLFCGCPLNLKGAASG